MPVDINDTKAVLTAAADLLQNTSWGQGEYAQDNMGNGYRIVGGEWVQYGHASPSKPDCFCSIGAIMEVTRENSAIVGHSDAMYKLAEFLDPKYVTVADWNDSSDTDIHEVVNTFRKAADSCP